LHVGVVDGAEKLRAKLFLGLIEKVPGVFGFNDVGVGIDDHNFLLGGCSF
jgi:hypothetical protein